MSRTESDFRTSSPIPLYPDIEKATCLTAPHWIPVPPPAPDAPFWPNRFGLGDESPTSTSGSKHASPRQLVSLLRCLDAPALSGQAFSLLFSTLEGQLAGLHYGYCDDLLNALIPSGLSRDLKFAALSVLATKKNQLGNFDSSVDAMRAELRGDGVSEDIITSTFCGL